MTTESEITSNSTTDDIDKQKSVEFHSAAVNAWFNTRLELDKNILTLSSGGVGLLISLMSTTGIHTTEKLLLYISSIICFVICIGSSLLIFKFNSSKIEEIINNEPNKIDKILKTLDSINYLSFFSGIFLAIIIGISSAVDSYDTYKQNEIRQHLQQQQQQISTINKPNN